MELWDVLDREGRKKGRTMVRGHDIRSDDYHLVVHIWVRNGKGEYLIQKRADYLSLNPGIWAATGGSVVAGEESQIGALRELEEEICLRLNPDELSRLMRFVEGNSIVDVWFAELDEGVLEQVRPGQEVSEVAFASKEQIKKMISTGEFYAYSYVDELED